MKELFNSFLTIFFFVNFNLNAVIIFKNETTDKLMQVHICQGSPTAVLAIRPKEFIEFNTKETLKGIIYAGNYQGNNIFSFYDYITLVYFGLDNARIIVPIKFEYDKQYTLITYNSTSFIHVEHISTSKSR